MSLSKNDLKNAIETLGLKNENVCIHSSIRSFGDVIENGIQTIVDAFLDENCTIIVPSFSYEYEVAPGLSLKPSRNGCNYDYLNTRTDYLNLIYSNDSKVISKGDMGLLPLSILDLPEHERGIHPRNSFTGIGPFAKDIISKQTTIDIYAPFREMYNRGGYILLMGVELTSATIIHFAEQVAGRVPFIRWANDSDGNPMPVSTGSCSKGFQNFSSYLSQIEKKFIVGKSCWRCYPVKEMVDICSELIKNDPYITHCSDPNCEQCNDAMLGGPIW